MSRDARFEIVRTDAGFHSRFRAKNGRIVWTTEVYTRRGKALAACRTFTGDRHSTWGRLLHNAHGWLEVRDVDERQAVA